VFAADKVIDV